MNEGISTEEACKLRAIGTKEDFERLCNPDGTVKKQLESTTISIKDTDYSITVPNIALQTFAMIIVTLAIIAVYLLTRKLLRKK